MQHAEESEKGGEKEHVYTLLTRLKKNTVRTLGFIYSMMNQTETKLLKVKVVMFTAFESVALNKSLLCGPF